MMQGTSLFYYSYSVILLCLLAAPSTALLPCPRCTTAAAVHAPAFSSRCEGSWNSKLFLSIEILDVQNQTASTGLITKRPTKDDDDDRSTGVLALQQQAAALRADIASIESDIKATKEAKRRKELADIDRWIEECLYVSVPTNNKDNDDDNDSRIELLNSVDKTATILRDKRYSHEHVSKMFERICETSPAQSRSNCSPLLALLVDAAGKLDCVDRDKNPNKRCDGKVERDLRKRLFAMDWGIHLEIDENNNERFL